MPLFCNVPIKFDISGEKTWITLILKRFFATKKPSYDDFLKTINLLFLLSLIFFDGNQ